MSKWSATDQNLLSQSVIEMMSCARGSERSLKRFQRETGPRGWRMDSEEMKRSGKEVQNESGQSLATRS